MLVIAATRPTILTPSAQTLTPDVIDKAVLGVTIPGTTAPGNYDLQAVKERFASSPVVISIVPEVTVTDVTGDAMVTISGSGFGGYQPDSGTSVTTTITTGKGKKRKTQTVEATIVSWTETSIVAQFDSAPSEVTVTSVFGTATAEVGGGGNGKGKGNRKGNRGGGGKRG